MNAPNKHAAFSAVMPLPGTDVSALLAGPKPAMEFLVLVLPGFSLL